MTAKFFVIGNWKTNPKGIKEVTSFHDTFKKNIRSVKNVDIVIAPSALHIGVLASKKPSYKLGIQNISLYDLGAHTGSMSAEQLATSDISYCIVGHSENRKEGETDEIINEKIHLLLKKKVTPIVCVGEKERDEDHSYVRVLSEQIQKTFKGLSPALLSKIIIAYEPVWAIGKDAVREATPEESNEACILIRRVLSDMYGMKSISKTSVIYGGSVSSKNSGEFLRSGGISGFLVGRASLLAKEFSLIIEQTELHARTLHIK